MFGKNARQEHWPRRPKWPLIRRILQTASFLIFFAIVLSLAYPLAVPFDTRLIFHLNPLTHVWLLITRQPLVSVGWAIAAFAFWLVLGRTFCGWICPLGAILDFSNAFVKWFSKVFTLYPNAEVKPLNRWESEAPDNPRLRLPSAINLFLLGALLTLAVFKMPLIWILDPIVLSFKFATVALWPALDRPARAAYYVLDNKLYASDAWYPVSHFFNKFVLPYREPTYVDTLLIIGFMLALLIVNRYHRRWWCKYVCPLGALLRITYFVNPIKRRITSGCTNCLLCEVDCHFSGDAVADCIYCMECADACPKKAITFLPARDSFQPEYTRNHDILSANGATDISFNEARHKLEHKIRTINTLRPNLNRRAFLGSIAAGALCYPFLELFNQKVRLPDDFIRPPGVTDEFIFSELCIKCGQCLKVCLTNGLQPALFEAGLDGLWTPRLVSRIGCCEFECNMCGQVCPTGAIPPLSIDNKKAEVLGTADINSDRCIPFVTETECIVCEEHCPVSPKAIELDDVLLDRNRNSVKLSKRPRVLQDKCTGCGICEFVCPLDGASAIRVFRPAVKLGEVELGRGGYPA